MAGMQALIPSVGANTCIDAKLQHTFKENSLDKGKKKKKSSSNISLFLEALWNVCNPRHLDT